jgi:phenylalanine-4-hydroxylase
MIPFPDFHNAQVANLPPHLKQFIVDQNYPKYTPIDQAVWRFVMRQNYNYLRKVAYYPYIKGLQRAGLSIEHIPDLQTMNDNLGKIGWGAVTVDGFIPPAAFMEFQAYRVLVIAADIRQINHIEYTPAPDIIHESAGHAPIIAETDYSKYLSYFGSIGSKAMFSRKDFELYEAIRKLSILKEAIDTTAEEIDQAEFELKTISENMGAPSEMALLSRLHWWTVEYGLIGTLENPKIYGAGLLSSIGESASCMQAGVPKLWYDSQAVNFAYDITKPQPQLFVTPDFQNLMNVLEDFANTMAFRKGGAESIAKAVECKNSCTAVYSSGLQLTGVFISFMLDSEKELSFIKTEGSSALSFENQQLEGHSKTYHASGFSSPVGKLKSIAKPLEDFSLIDLEQIGITEGKRASFEFESGINVEGLVQKILQKNEKIILISFEDCTVQKDTSEKLFLPEWGTYDMAVGQKIVSVFNGAADKSAFEEVVEISSEKTIPAVYTETVRALHGLYAQVREIRETQKGLEELPKIASTLKEIYPEDWLCTLEILEIVHPSQRDKDFENQLRAYLTQKQNASPEINQLIEDGLALIESGVSQLIINEDS